jgi:cutinase
MIATKKQEPHSIPVGQILNPRMHLVIYFLMLFSLAFAIIVEEDDVVDKLPCKALTLIYARGTFELGNMGELVGPELVEAVKSAVGSDTLAVQGVDYNSWGIGGDPEGSMDMI